MHNTFCVFIGATVISSHEAANQRLLASIDSETRLKRIGETIDRLISLDLWCKFAGPDAVLAMYEAALEQVKPRHRSLTLAAAEALQDAIKPGAKVLVCTGLVLPPWMIAESDGPPGAAAIARLANLAFKASSVIFVPPKWVDAMRKVVIASGMTPIDDMERLQGKRGACAVVGYPTEDEPALVMAKALIDSGEVAAVIALETPGRNPSGRYVTGAHGYDISADTARFDCLFEAANRRGVLTIGIGDHGGEIGLGSIADSIRKVVPTAIKGDAADITPVTGSRVPIIAGISNWGAYGLEAAMAALAGRPDLIHTGADERRILNVTADAGFLAGMVGLPLPIVDGVSCDDNAAFVDLLRLAVIRGMEAPFPRAVGFNP